MKEYAILSLETHLFFGRIMKEHSLFLLAGFPAKETEFIRRANRFRKEFEEGLRKTVNLADGIVSRAVLDVYLETLENSTEQRKESYKTRSS